MPLKVDEFNGGVPLTEIQDGDIFYVIRSGTDQFAEAETVREYSSGLLKFDITIPTAEVLTGNTVPVELVPALGANLVAVLVELYEVVEYGGVAYATNANSTVKYSSGPIVLTGIDIGYIANTYRQWQLGNGSVIGFTPLIPNEAIIWQVDTGNPTAGNSDIRYIGYYRIIDVS
jgi:hypothetical protein